MKGKKVILILGMFMMSFLVAVAEGEENVLEEVQTDVQVVSGGFDTASSLVRQGKYQQAKNIFKQDLSKNRNLLGAATAARLNGDYEEAIGYYTELIDTNAGYNEAYFGRAMAYRGIEEHKRAINDFLKFLEKDKTEYAYAGVADLYLLTGKVGEAKQILEEASGKYPNSELIKKLLVRAYSK